MKTWPECCSCRPGDGTEECESLDDCYEAWHRFTYPDQYTREGGTDAMVVIEK